jgi:hypothetical protein
MPEDLAKDIPVTMGGEVQACAICSVGMQDETVDQTFAANRMGPHRKAGAKNRPFRGA